VYPTGEILYVESNVPWQNCSAKMRGWSSQQGLYRLRHSLLERNPSRQPVQTGVSYKGEDKNSLKAYACIVSEQFVQPESGQGLRFGKIYSDRDIRY
jgi:hypothetical protein